MVRPDDGVVELRSTSVPGDETHSYVVWRALRQVPKGTARVRVIVSQPSVRLTAIWASLPFKRSRLSFIKYARRAQEPRRPGGQEHRYRLLDSIGGGIPAIN